MTLTELDQIENDLRKVDAKFPGDYSTAKAMELAAALRKLITPTETPTQMATTTAMATENLGKTQYVPVYPLPE